LVLRPIWSTGSASGGWASLPSPSRIRHGSQP
jgi:hypothetical protein